MLSFDRVEQARVFARVDGALRRRPTSGVRVGRYRVLRKLGQGGMGVVYLAHDPQLDRDIVIKVLHATTDGGSDARILAEARSIAALEHPHVVQVFDIGRFDPSCLLRARWVTQAPESRPRVFIAMEYVPGQTLTAWLRRSRTRAEIVAMFRQAGTGLAAGHTRGVVHRDFKPDNVLVGRDGRVRVVDFGLARSGMATASLASTIPPSFTGRARKTGSMGSAIVGTPRYMSPEQMRGLRVDARADQYSLCVALFEALTGRAPFAEGDWATLLAAKSSLNLLWPDDLPQWLVDVLRRGLAPESAHRFDSIAALLEALGRAPRPRRRSMARAGLALVALSALPLLTCALRAPPAGPQVDLPMDATSARTGGVTVGPLTPSGALADSLARADAAIGGANRSALLAASSDAMEIAARAGDPTAMVQARLRHGRALLAHARFDDATAVLQTAFETAAALRWDEAQADAALELLRVAGQAADPDAGDRWARQASSSRDRLGPSPVRSARLSYLQGITEHVSARLEVAEELMHDAVQRYEALPKLALERALAHSGLAQVLDSRGRVDEAAEQHRLAIELAAVAVGTDHPTVAQLRSNYARNRSFYDRGALDEARAIQQRAIEILERQFGPEDLAVGNAREALAQTLALDGDLERAQRELGRAVAIQRACLGPRSPAVAAAMVDLAGIRALHGDYAGAAAAAREAVMTIDPLHGGDSLESGYAHGALARALGGLERWADALGHAQTAVDIFERHLPSGHLARGLALRSLGRALAYTGQPTRAAETLQRAVGVFDGAGPPSVFIERTRFLLARQLVAAGRRREGLGAAARSHEVLASLEPDSSLGADVATWLAHRRREENRFHEG